ncbi:hypothetical protein ACP4OV_030472 [Aristida adscensionis]
MRRFMSLGSIHQRPKYRGVGEDGGDDYFPHITVDADSYDDFDVAGQDIRGEELPTKRAPFKQRRRWLVAGD